MSKYFVGNVYFVDYPYDDSDDEKACPAIVLEATDYEILAIKVTRHEKRISSDIPIKLWEQAGLKYPSYARTSKMVIIPTEDILFHMGSICSDDLLNILESVYKLYE